MLPVGILQPPWKVHTTKRCRHSKSCSAKPVAPSQHDPLQLIFPIGVPCSFHYAGLVCVFPATRLCFGGCEQSSQVPRGGYCLGLLGVVHACVLVAPPPAQRVSLLSSFGVALARYRYPLQAARGVDRHRHHCVLGRCCVRRQYRFAPTAPPRILLVPSSSRCTPPAPAWFHHRSQAAGGGAHDRPGALGRPRARRHCRIPSPVRRRADLRCSRAGAGQRHPGRDEAPDAGESCGGTSWGLCWHPTFTSPSPEFVP